MSDGIDFEGWRLRDGRFGRTDGPPLRIRFVDPQDVYRFRVLAP